MVFCAASSDVRDICADCSTSLQNSSGLLATEIGLDDGNAVGLPPEDSLLLVAAAGSLMPFLDGEHLPGDIKIPPLVALIDFLKSSAVSPEDIMSMIWAASENVSCVLVGKLLLLLPVQRNYLRSEGHPSVCPIDSATTFVAPIPTTQGSWGFVLAHANDDQI